MLQTTRTGPLSYYSSAPVAVRLLLGGIALILAVYVGATWPLTMLHSHGATDRLDLGLLVAFIGLALGVIILAPESTIYIDPETRTVDVFTTVRGRSFGPTYRFNEILAVQAAARRNKYGAITSYVVAMRLKGRWLPLDLTSYSAARDAALEAERVRQVIFGDTAHAPLASPNPA